MTRLAAVNNSVQQSNSLFALLPWRTRQDDHAIHPRRRGGLSNRIDITVTQISSVAYNVQTAYLVRSGYEPAKRRRAFRMIELLGATLVLISPDLR